MEILDFAIQMEKDGETYYTHQADVNKDNGLRSIFLMLALEEAKHAGILQSISDGKPYDLVSRDSVAENMNLFQNVSDYIATTKAIPEQTDLYEAAKELEQKSIDLYQDLLNKATDDASRALFTFLVKEETDHYTVMDDLYHFVNRPKEWVEAAEFGVRQEY